MEQHSRIVRYVYVRVLRFVPEKQNGRPRTMSKKKKKTESKTTGGPARRVFRGGDTYPVNAFLILTLMDSSTTRLLVSNSIMVSRAVRTMCRRPKQQTSSVSTNRRVQLIRLCAQTDDGNADGGPYGRAGTNYYYYYE